MEAATAKPVQKDARIIQLTVACVLIVCIASALYASQAISISKFVSVVAVSLIIGSAALFLGGLLGFLFGIPRTLQQDRVEMSKPETGKTNGENDESQGISYQVNTNLEQISDWLTKIIVGVGLTQISTFPGALHKYAQYASVGLGNYPGSEVFSSALLIYSLVCGFLISYLWTRLYLAGAFRQADLASIGGKLTEVESKVSELEKQTQIDAKALSLVQRQLNHASDSSPIPQEELNEAILSASPDVRAQVFYQARTVRSATWQESQTKPRMERTIPLFKALIASDRDDVYHENHGQLGFAMKDQRHPNWNEAEAEISKAIQLRGPWQRNGWLLYELNRAICRINLDEAFKQEKPSEERIKQGILEDIKAAANAPTLIELIKTESTIGNWMELNNVSCEAIVQDKA